MKIRLNGFERVAQNLDRVMASVKEAAQRSNAQEGNRLLDHLKERASHEFQETVSYVWESILGLPGTKPEYADRELVGTFARTAPKLDHPWDRQIQLYRKERHQLRNLLARMSTERPRGVYVTRVGYPRDVGRRGRRTRYIVWVLFGTRKMQARPFLQLTLDEHAADYLAEITRGIQQALARAPLM